MVELSDALAGKVSQAHRGGRMVNFLSVVDDRPRFPVWTGLGPNMQKVEPGTMDTLSKIQAMLSKEYDLPMERLAPDQSLADLGIDSLTTIEFMFKLEDKFSIRLSEERGNLATVNDIAVLVDAVLRRNTAKA